MHETVNNAKHGEWGECADRRSCFDERPGVVDMARQAPCQKGQLFRDPAAKEQRLQPYSLCDVMWNAGHCEWQHCGLPGSRAEVHKQICLAGHYTFKGGCGF